MSDPNEDCYVLWESVRRQGHTLTSRGAIVMHVPPLLASDVGSLDADCPFDDTTEVINSSEEDETPRCTRRRLAPPHHQHSQAGPTIESWRRSGWMVKWHRPFGR